MATNIIPMIFIYNRQCIYIFYYSNKIDYWQFKSEKRKKKFLLHSNFPPIAKLFTTVLISIAYIDSKNYYKFETQFSL